MYFDCFKAEERENDRVTSDDSESLYDKGSAGNSNKRGKMLRSKQKKRPARVSSCKQFVNKKVKKN